MPKEPETAPDSEADSASTSDPQSKRDQLNAERERVVALQRTREMFDAQFAELETQWKEIEDHRAENIRRQERLEKKALTVEEKRVEYTRRLKKLDGRRLQLDNERRALEQQRAEAEAGERDLASRREAAVAAEKELADRLRAMEEQRHALEAESKRIAEAQKQIERDRARLADIEERADKLDQHEAQLDEKQGAVAAGQSALADARKEHEARQGRLDEERRQFDEAVIAFQRSTDDLAAREQAMQTALAQMQAGQEQLAVEQSALAEQRGALTEQQDKLEADRAAMEEQRKAFAAAESELAARAAALEAERGEHAARMAALEAGQAAHLQAMNRLNEARDRLARQQEAFDETAEAVLKERGELEEQKESLAKRRRRLEALQQELDERARRLANEDMKGRALVEYDRLQVELGRLKHKREELKEKADKLSRHDQRVRQVDARQRRRDRRMKKLRELLGAKLREIRARSRGLAPVGPADGSYGTLDDEKFLGDEDAAFSQLTADDPPEFEAEPGHDEPATPPVPAPPKEPVALSVVAPLAEANQMPVEASAADPSATRGPSAVTRAAEAAGVWLKRGRAKTAHGLALAARGIGGACSRVLTRMTFIPAALARAWKAFMSLSVRTRAVGTSVIALALAATFSLCLWIAHLSIEPSYRASIVLSQSSPIERDALLTDAALTEAIDLLAQRGLRPYESAALMREQLDAHLSVQPQPSGREGRLALHLDSPRREEAVFILEALGKVYVQSDDAGAKQVAIAAAAPLTPHQDGRWAAAVTWFLMILGVAAAICLLPLLAMRRDAPLAQENAAPDSHGAAADGNG